MSYYCYININNQLLLKKNVGAYSFEVGEDVVTLGWLSFSQASFIHRKIRENIKACAKS